jgi:hypothetical protein
MNKTILSLSMLSLGVIIGFLISHFSGAEEQADDEASQQMPLKRQLEASYPDALSDMNREMKLVSGAGGNGGRTNGDMATKSPDEVLLDVLLAIRNEQKQLKEQIAESNRDIDELTFRVDTHSDSFRPLNTLNQRPRAIEVGEEPSLREEVGTTPPGP